MPIQRIPRYVMLLSDLLKHTEPNHLDYKNISTGLNKVQGVATYINENVINFFFFSISFIWF